MISNNMLKDFNFKTNFNQEKEISSHILVQLFVSIKDSDPSLCLFCQTKANNFVYVGCCGSLACFSCFRDHIMSSNECPSCHNEILYFFDRIVLHREELKVNDIENLRKKHVIQNSIQEKTKQDFQTHCDERFYPSKQIEDSTSYKVVHHKFYKNKEESSFLNSKILAEENVKILIKRTTKESIKSKTKTTIKQNRNGKNIEKIAEDLKNWIDTRKDVHNNLNLNSDIDFNDEENDNNINGKIIEPSNKENIQNEVNYDWREKNKSKITQQELKYYDNLLKSYFHEDDCKASQNKKKSDEKSNLEALPFSSEKAGILDESNIDEITKFYDGKIKKSIIIDEDSINTEQWFYSLSEQEIRENESVRNDLINLGINTGLVHKCLYDLKKELNESKTKIFEYSLSNSSKFVGKIYFSSVDGNIFSMQYNFIRL